VSKPTRRDLEILEALRHVNEWWIGERWARPMDIGGHTGSDHAYRLTRLMRLGWVEGRERTHRFRKWEYRGLRTFLEYHITAAGRAILAGGVPEKKPAAQRRPAVGFLRTKRNASHVL